MIVAVNHDTPRKLWCGPAAIAAITGKPVSEIERSVLAVRRRNKWYSPMRRKVLAKMYSSEITRQMKALGKRTKKEVGTETLRNFIFDKGHLGPMIVLITGHFIAISNGQWIDNDNTTPRPLTEIPAFWLRCKVRAYWRVK